MVALIVVDSEFGNTARLAEAVAEGMEALDPQIRRLGSENGLPDELNAFDLLALAGPTMNRHASPRLGALLKRLPELRGAREAAFDTRLRGPELVMGSAAKQAAGRLREVGAQLVSPKESFFVRRVAAAAGGGAATSYELEMGELERARAWGAALAQTAAARREA